MMDEPGSWRIVNKCALLQFKFERISSADNFPVTLRENTFVIVNSDNSEKDGTHWLLYCNRQNEYSLATHWVYLFNLQENFLSCGFD